MIEINWKGIQESNVHFGITGSLVSRLLEVAYVLRMSNCQMFYYLNVFISLFYSFNSLDTVGSWNNIAQIKT